MMKLYTVPPANLIYARKTSLKPPSQKVAFLIKMTKKFAEAEWIEYTDDIGTIPAGWEDMISAGLSDFISGYQFENKVGIHRFKKINSAKSYKEK
jgi:hypothetical protein